MNKNKKWCILFLIEFSALTFLIAVFTIIIDPFFHYHKPLSFLEYPINNQRYQNDGIVKHFNYDAIITGTSMTENFKTSEMDALFNVNSIKVPFSGGSFKEINQNLERAIKSNDNIRYIFRGIDFSSLLNDKDYMKYDYSNYPLYLYDNSFINDVSYVFNKEVLFKNTLGVLNYYLDGKTTTSFDEYSYWNDAYQFGKNAVDKTYVRVEKKGSNEPLTNDEINRVKENIQQNLLQLAKDNPDIKFYYFYTPYSIYYWDSINNSSQLLKQIEAEKIATEMLLELDNVNLFSFWDEIGIIEDLNNYKDIIHYSSEINSKILKWMSVGEKLLTKANYTDYYKEILRIYEDYDYDSLFS